MFRPVRLALTLIGALWLAAPRPAHAETHTIEGAHVQVWLPDAWPLATDDTDNDGHLLAVTSPDAGVAVVLVSRSDVEIPGAVELIDEELAGFVEDIETDGQPERGVHNEMDAARLRGHGRVDEVAVAVSLLVLRPATGDPLIVLTVVREDASAEDLEALDEILGSLTAVEIY